MPQFAVEFHPLAADEAGAAERWYRERNETASARFRRELDRAVDLICERPEAGSPYLTSTRRFLLRRFPSSLCIVFSMSGSRSSPWRMRGDVQGTGASVSATVRSVQEAKPPAMCQENVYGTPSDAVKPIQLKDFRIHGVAATQRKGRRQVSCFRTRGDHVGPAGVPPVHAGDHEPASNLRQG